MIEGVLVFIRLVFLDTKVTCQSKVLHSHFLSNLSVFLAVFRLFSSSSSLQTNYKLLDLP